MRSGTELREHPPLELLGVVQYLAGGRRPGRTAPRADRRLEARFGRWAGHPAVRRYAAASREVDGAESFGLYSLFLSGPGLEWQADPRTMSHDFLRRAGGPKALDAFVAALRDFARRSDFAGFYAGQAALFRREHAKARRVIARRDAMRLLEDYLGEPLDSRHLVHWPVFYTPNPMHCYIVPYPYQGPGVAVEGPFTVYTIAEAGDRGSEAPFFLWNEPLYVFVERAFAAHEAEFRALAPAGDAEAWCARAKHRLMQALARRLARRAGRGVEAGDAVQRALSARLREYERARGRYPALRELLPRLLEALSGR